MTKHLNRIHRRILSWVLVVVLLGGSFCSNNHNGTSDSVSELTRRALDQGDTLAYNILSRDYQGAPYDAFLHTALIMANRYQYAPAYADVYYCLTDSHHKADGAELDDLDEKTKRLAIEYLMDGVKCRNKDCLIYLGRHYILGKHFPKDSVKGAQLIAEGEL